MEEGEDDDEVADRGRGEAAGPSAGGEGYVPVHKRRQMESQRAQRYLGGAGGGGPGEEEFPVPEDRPAGPAEEPQGEGGGGAGGPRESLLVRAARQRETEPAETEAERLLKEEEEIIRQLTTKKALKAVQELAKDVRYTKSMPTGWRPPARLRLRTPEHHDAVRKALHIVVEWHNIPPPVPRFEDLKLPAPLLEHLRGKGITKPSPIQVQGIPVALSGRDMIGVAFTGSGKTTVFTLPMVMMSLQEELRMPLHEREGPLGFILAPSRELARQTAQIAEAMCEALERGGYPKMDVLTAIGGLDVGSQLKAHRGGTHMCVGTTGRLKDMLSRRRINLDICKFMCLDEADRMVDMGFEEDIREVMSFFKGQRQTLMFSATMPQKILTFAESALVDPITVNVGRAGATNVDITQEVELVRDEERMHQLKDALQKTPPPVLIFSENKNDVDAIHEYLLVQGVEVVAIHGSKDQEERNWAMDEFKAGNKDVLIATDVASKGLDFPKIEHVINFDMPKEIENYVHRIGRTGRAGNKGWATTFITSSCGQSILLDLRHILKEAKQRIPPFLEGIKDPNATAEELEAATGRKGCAYCGGLGHRVTDCPKLRADTNAAKRARMGGGAEG